MADTLRMTQGAKHPQIYAVNIPIIIIGFSNA